MDTAQSGAEKEDRPVADKREQRRTEVQPDMYGGEDSYSGDCGEDATGASTDIPIMPEDNAMQEGENFARHLHSLVLNRMISNLCRMRRFTSHGIWRHIQAVSMR